MHTEIVLAGFGGQGVLLIGKLLAYAGMRAGLQVTWMPAYGPEMRGGTCNCTVVLSDRPIGSPISRHPHGLIALNLPSLDKFEADVRPGGVIAVNTSLINRLPARTDVVTVPVAANEVAMAGRERRRRAGARAGHRGGVLCRQAGRGHGEPGGARARLRPRAGRRRGDSFVGWSFTTKATNDTKVRGIRNPEPFALFVSFVVRESFTLAGQGIEGDRWPRN
jgi:hypothetical protein